MQSRTARLIAVPAVVTALVATGCSGEDLVESGIERAIEHEADGAYADVARKPSRAMASRCGVRMVGCP